ncbi:GLPGLI family protein [Riemerella anatipestifer]|uniref:GLPGLI family protein n=1 Tax=Riemerella anatipestifer TaxID=34085 RepID=UPI00129E4F2C|nr:GLPGLI family protein [Riemerella anatipestifer]MRM83114.1 GLPGLI family protein [Riemerella anatipestifer]
MGKLRYLVIFICCLSQNILSQQYEITYEVIFQPRLGDTLKLKDYYALKFNLETKESLFASLGEDDAINVSVYKNFKKDDFVKYETILNNLYSINYQFDANSWDLINVKKNILGYQCNKAEISFGNRKWEAWYTTDISFYDGPYKFSHLPGIIIDIYSLDGEYRFKGIAIQKKENIQILKPKSIHFKSIEKEQDFKSGIIKDPASLYRNQMMQLKSNNMGVSIKYDGKEITQKETEQKIVDDFEKWRGNHNNPIEKGYTWIR